MVYALQGGKDTSQYTFSETEEWVDLKDENTMYSPTLQDHGITDWEAGMCP